MSVPAAEQGPAPLPLTTAQLGVWFAHQADPGSAVYNLAQYLEIHGPVDGDLLQGAIRDAEVECETFDVSFGEDDDGPHQRIVGHVGRGLRRLDLSGEPDPLAAARSWMDAERATPVDISRDPLSLDALIKLADEHHIWYNRCHHLLVDGYGGALFTQRVTQLYTARLAGAEPPAAGRLGTLSDLVREEAEYRASGQFEQDRAYWGERFADRPEPVSLSDRPAAAPGEQALRETLAVSQQDLDAMRGSARRARTTWTALMVAAVGAYLHRMTGAAEVTLGIPVSARRRGAARETPGMMANELPLRLSLHPAMTKDELLRHAAAQLGELLVRQCYPYDDLRRRLRLLRGNRHLFGISVNILIFGGELGFAGLPTSAHNLSGGPIKDLAITVYDASDGSGLQVDFDANPARYEQHELSGHRARFGAFLSALTEADAGLPIGRLEIATPAERAQVSTLHGRQRPAASALADGSVHGRFERQARATPLAEAVVCGRTRLTYAELDARADRLAERLRAAAVGPEDRVAVLQSRSADLVVSLLAVLKAGGVYVPLDVRSPASRLLEITQATGVRVLLTDQCARGLADFGHGARVLVVDADRDEEAGNAGFEAEGQRVEAADATPGGADLAAGADRLAYVMFTSGSTGGPKGVAATHRGVLELAADRCFTPEDQARVLLHSAQAFDAIVYELWVPLLGGGTVVICPSPDLDVPGLAALVTEQRLTSLWLTAGLFRMVAQEQPQALRGVRQVWTGGDVVSAAMVRRVLEHCPGLTVVDGYGPTETTVFATCHPMRSPSQVPDAVPIGRPLEDTRVYVLDGALRLLPPGAVGELYVGGAGLARGYFGRAAATAERFVADPYGPPGARMYRTGDLVRWSADGTLLFAGRADQQIKLRGFRIEPGEIESALAAHPLVAQSAVVLREDQPGIRRLTAYVVPADGAPGCPDAQQLRAHLAARLPDYMVPAAFIDLPKLPVTANGKLDRAALPVPGGADAEAEGRAPATERERILREVFADVLGRPGVGVEQDFFDLGGDSIISIQLAARARAAGIEITPRDVFEHPTVAALAAVARETRAEPAGPADADAEPLIELDLDELAELETQWENSR
ncbi:amino acid adenylation domain-containing protein [Actinocrinis puniceicyclus]|uniref:Amino acid adenylation domain-containing protein n=1 Tax=Actinocrinis puniceicyclus TaxID=977794 RepID=A0A8J7WMA8_9ACTN|nr:non-ribosomal peptide synthetase [Actinocrinis puniceicyclus]MBS2965021.1 amino acid adenylation domain-containing protein [Actinocrinis puniceicyclus]